MASRSCIDSCLECHRACLQTVASAGSAGPHAEHLLLMVNCAELCLTTARFMMTSPGLDKVLAQACATVCMACAEQCDQHEGMRASAAACRHCATHCKLVVSESSVTS